jgi:hypothetical protein
MSESGRRAVCTCEGSILTSVRRVICSLHTEHEEM